METNNPQSLYANLATKLFLIALIILFLVVAQDLLIPLTLALFFSFLLMPVSAKLERWGLPKSISIIITSF